MVLYENVLKKERELTDLENWPDRPGARLRCFSPRIVPRMAGTVYYTSIRVTVGSRT
jgi:hypothetical protein